MKYLRILSPFIFIGAITIFLFYRVLFLKEVFFGTFDNFSYVIPLKYFFVEEIKKGIFPLWNPYFLTGIPYVGDLTIGTFSIFNIFYFLFPVANAIGVVTAISFFLIGVFQYFYLRLLKISKIGSLFGGVTFAFAGNIFINFGAVDFVNTIVFIPLIFIVVYLFVKTVKIQYFLLLILLQALQLTSGHPRPTFYTVQFVTFFFLFWSNFSLKKRFILILFYFIGMLLLTSIQLLPFIENAFYSTRPLSNINFASSSSLSISHLITFFLPTFFGLHKYGTWWGPQVELFGYMGIPAYIFLFIGIIRAKIINKSFYLISCVLSFLLALGKISPVYILAYYLIPGWKQFRAPIDVMVFFTFFASIFIASGFDVGIKHIGKTKTFAGKILRVLIPLFIVSSFIVFITNKKDFWSTFLHNVYVHTHLHVLSRILIYDNRKLQVMFGGIVFNLFLLTLFSCITFSLFYFLAKRKKVLALSLLIFSSGVFMYYDSLVIMTTPNSYPQVANPTRLISDARNGEYRIISLPIDLHQKKTSLADADFFYKESLVKFSILESGNNIQQGVYQANGFATLIPSSYEQFIGHNKANIISIDFSRITTNELNLSSIKYIISYAPLPSFSSPLILLSQNPQHYYLYENPTAYKRAYLEDNPQSNDVSIQQDTTQKLLIKVTSAMPTKLIISDLFYPGWEARVNGKNTSIYSYDNTFQMIAIPKGTSSIALSYQPISFKIGMIVSLLSLFGWSALFIILRKRTI